ncbi:hypothetical protein FPZ24_01565 [Sphingomonas panacisoli]|uniref:Uncharacterized protein n=1 Tax=Sphingomonas panacisoli TaxID=1813879 RepID=A0A5B8LDR7_9SPHN|nr:hypothetical protein [Sphingomonas panacisoli]QDZ06318.1 hypothetical protein FPZ24_01565 [Sphingomonas panacisoli]
MRFAKYLGAIAALSMATAPALAAPANPAASLSVAKSVRASSPTANANQLHGAGVFLAAAAVVGIIVAVVLIADDNKSKSK